MNNKLVFGIIAVASLALVMQRYKDKNICSEGYSLVQPKCLTTPCANFCVKNR